MRKKLYRWIKQKWEIVILKTTRKMTKKQMMNRWAGYTKRMMWQQAITESKIAKSCGYFLVLLLLGVCIFATKLGPIK